MRRSNFLVSDIRRDTENSGISTTTSGISDDAVLLAINDGQTWLFSELEKLEPMPFTEQVLMDSVAGQTEYELPSDAYLGSDVVSISYLTSAGSSSYSRLQMISIFERTTGNLRGSPTRYYMRQNKFGLNPAPPTSLSDAIRVNYTKHLPTVDKRRAQITAVTVTAGALTALTIDLTDFADYFPGEEDFDATRILIDDYFCIVDVDGNIKARRVPITAISASTGVCTLSAYTPEFDTDTATIGDYLVAGRYASSHSQLPDEAESFLIHFAKSQVFESDGNRAEAATEADRAKLLGQTVISGWAKLFDDIEYVPIINPNNT